ncbi:MAG: CHASE2 domain-containing protein [Candidatus Protistobacter heckmanni]|nr:CHASE2 domain-containing protein [Candidatus Protistobacter heckmanni]
MIHRVLEWINARLEGKLARRGIYVYVVLAILCSAFALVDLKYTGIISLTETKIFDLLVKARLFVKKPSPDVVIVDIDEGSLQDMAKQYGRWPWPNQIFADLLTGLDRQNPKAVVFDILFSDRDTLRPESDAAFNAAVAKSSTAFFPMVRLSAENDAKSRIKTAWLPGARRLEDQPTADSGIALILPQVPAALESGRMGFLNVYPDKDGILRRYPLRLDNDGWRFDSYALKVARTAGAKPREDAADFLINWRGGPFTYRFLSFKDLYHGLRGDPGAKPPPELKDKIVIVGSTAPALFDIKATPVARLHPGVEILATAIDNLAAGDAIRTLPNIVPPLLGSAAAAGHSLYVGGGLRLLPQRARQQDQSAVHRQPGRLHRHVLYLPEFLRSVRRSVGGDHLRPDLFLRRQAVCQMAARSPRFVIFVTREERRGIFRGDS